MGGGEPTPFQYSHAPQNAPVNHRGTQYFCCMHVRSADCAVQLKYLSASTANQHLIPSGQAPLRQLISKACNAPSLQTLYACNITTLPRVDVQAKYTQAQIRTCTQLYTCRAILAHHSVILPTAFCYPTYDSQCTHQAMQWRADREGNACTAHAAHSLKHQCMCVSKREMMACIFVHKLILCL
jgi:hypothetical protein